MKSPPLVCLLIGAITIIDNDSVLAKQICRCHDKAKLFTGTWETVHESCTPKFACYRERKLHYCEVTPEKRLRFDECCDNYRLPNEPSEKLFIGIVCKEMPDENIFVSILKLLRIIN